MAWLLLKDRAVNLLHVCEIVKVGSSGKEIIGIRFVGDIKLTINPPEGWTADDVIRVASLYANYPVQIDTSLPAEYYLAVPSANTETPYIPSEADISSLGDILEDFREIDRLVEDIEKEMSGKESEVEGDVNAQDSVH